MLSQVNYHVRMRTSGLGDMLEDVIGGALRCGMGQSKADPSDRTLVRQARRALNTHMEALRTQLER